MINALRSIASVQSLGFAANIRASVPAAEMRLRGNGVDRGSNHGNSSDAIPDTAPDTTPDYFYWLDDLTLRISLGRLSIDRLCRMGLLRLWQISLGIERLLPLFLERSEFLGFTIGFHAEFKGGCKSGFVPGFRAAFLKQFESQSFRHCGRAIWQFSAKSTPC